MTACEFISAVMTAQVTITQMKTTTHPSLSFAEGVMPKHALILRREVFVRLQSSTATPHGGVAASSWLPICPFEEFTLGPRILTLRALIEHTVHVGSCAGGETDAG